MSGVFGYLVFCAFFSYAFCCLVSCDKDVFDLGKDTADERYMPTDKEPISSLLSADSTGRFSEYIRVLDVADMYNALNQSTSGTSFTAFVPDNDAMLEFYQRIGVSQSDIETKGSEYWRQFVLYHTKKDSILPEKFILLKSFSNLSGDVINVSIDSCKAGQATLFGEGNIGDGYGQVVEMGLSAYNGKVYVMGRAMTPLTETVSDRVKNNPSSSIMAEALQQTHWGDSLDVVTDTSYVATKKVITHHYFTFLNVSDAAFAKEGITSLADLTARLGGEQALGQYVRYHTLMNTYSYSALVAIPAGSSSRLLSTAAENQIMAISAAAADAAPIVNADGYPANFVSEGCELLARNGYVHEVDAWLPVWEPKQSVVVWDFADYTEVKNIVIDKLGAEFYQPAEPTAQEKTVGITNAKCYTYEESKDSPKNKAAAVTYATCTKNFSEAVNLDRVQFNVGYMGSIAMQTPTIVKGKYKVELSLTYTALQSFLRSRTNSKGGEMKISFDGRTDTEKYVAPYTQVSKITPGVYTSTLYDEIEFEETATHTFKFIVTDNAASSNANFSLQFDNIRFTPIE